MYACMRVCVYAVAGFMLDIRYAVCGEVAFGAIPSALETQAASASFSNSYHTAVGLVARRERAFYHSVPEPAGVECRREVPCQKICLPAR